MTKIFSPNNIEVLLHCHCSPSEHPRIDAPAVAEAIDSFHKMGAIQRVNGEGRVYMTTPFGRAWVEALCNVSPPRPAFLDEVGRVLKYDNVQVSTADNIPEV